MTLSCSGMHDFKDNAVGKMDFHKSTARFREALGNANITDELQTLINIF